MNQLKGIGSSSGIAIAPAFVLRESSPLHNADGRLDLEAELASFRKARDSVAQDLHEVAERARATSPTLASIVETHELMVQDPMVTEDIEQRIREGDSAIDAVTAEYSKQARLMYISTNSLLRDRAMDIQHVKSRLVAEILPSAGTTPLPRPSIVVSSTLTPSQMFQLSEQGACGFVVEDGGIDSHVSIIARDLALPAIVSARVATKNIADGQQLVIDGDAGICLIDPSDLQVEEYRVQQKAYQERLQHIRAVVGKVTTTLDGTTVTLLANVDNPLTAKHALDYGAQGIGLVRTEMMLSGNGSFPTMMQQHSWYRELLACAPSGLVTFRAFDIGGDKFGDHSPYIEHNPALGLRGIRFLLAQPEVFTQQVEAIIRVAAECPVRFMLPMVTSYSEVAEARSIINKQRERVEQELGKSIYLPIGIMIETPAAALLTDLLAPHVDFISIGTNDLTQYTLAADRTNDLVSNMFDCIHPSVIRLMTTIVDGAKPHGIEVSICGEMAAQITATDVLIGLGIRNFSVAPHSIPSLHRKLGEVSVESCMHLVEDVKKCRTSNEVRDAIAAHQARLREQGE